MANEYTWFTSMLVTGGCLLWVTSQRVLHVLNQDPGSAGGKPVPTWAAIFVVPLLLASYSKWSYQRKTRLHGCRTAKVYPHRDPILGIDWMLDMSKAMKSNQIMPKWHDLYNNFASTYWVNFLGKWTVMTSDPENVKALLAAQFELWPIAGTRREVIRAALGPHAIFAVNGKEWQAQRAKIKPSFVRNQLADLDCTDRHVDDLFERIPADGSKVDLQILFNQFMMDVSTDFMFGYSTDILTQPTQEALDFVANFDYVLDSSASKARLGWIMSLLPDEKQTKAFDDCQNFIGKYIARALADEKMQEREYVFLNELARSNPSEEEMRHQVLGMILGGKDTSASTLSCLFWNLARRPDIVKKLKAEVGALQGAKPTWDQLKNMTYLNYVLKETLRLYPPVQSNSRQCSQDTVLPKGGGPDGQSPIFAPAGTNCRFSSHSLHRRKDVYGLDAEEFRPERWETLRVSWEYIPFSGGPRICIGQQFALTQMLYLVARMLQKFDSFQAADRLPDTCHVSTTLSLAHGCWVQLQRM